MNRRILAKQQKGGGEKSVWLLNANFSTPENSPVEMTNFSAKKSFSEKFFVARWAQKAKSAGRKSVPFSFLYTSDMLTSPIWSSLSTKVVTPVIRRSLASFRTLVCPKAIFPFVTVKSVSSPPVAIVSPKMLVKVCSMLCFISTAGITSDNCIGELEY